MGKKYKNPPIIEAVCEFRLTPDSPWDLTVPGLIYEKIKKEFPHREQRLIQEIELTQGPQGLQQQIRTQEGVLFFTEDRKMFVHIGPHLLAINCLKPYPSWTGFQPKIEKAFQALIETVEEIKGLHRVGLRYINKIEMLSSPIKLEDYFEFYLYLGTRLPQNVANFIVGCDFLYANGRDQCRVQLKPTASLSSERPSFFLDIDYFTAKPNELKVTEAINWVKEAHNVVEEIFEGCINDRLRALFQEVREDGAS